jgi:hypothetical protein
MQTEKFYKIPQDLTCRKDLIPSDKLIFAVMLDFIGDNGHCWPGVRTLAKRTGLAVSSVIESIRRLELSKVLNIQRRGNGKSSHYSIPQSAPETRTVTKAKAHRKPNTGAPETRAQAHRFSEPSQTDLLNQTYSEVSFILENGKPWYLPEGKLSEYQETYPCLDVAAELRKARQWCIDNPARRKTARGMPAFLNRWLARTKPIEPAQAMAAQTGSTPRELMLAKINKGIANAD